MPNPEWMSLRIENPLIQWKNVVFTENEEQIFEELSEQEWLLHVVLLRPLIIHISDSRVSGSALCVLLEILHMIPRPLTIFFVFCGSPQVEPCFDDFWTKDIVGILTTFGFCLDWRRELEGFGTDAGGWKNKNLRGFSRKKLWKNEFSVKKCYIFRV